MDIEPTPNPSTQVVAPVAQPQSAPVTPNGGGKAIASLVLGILGMIAWFIPIIGLPIVVVGLTLGILSRKSSRKGLALAGIILSSIGLALTLINGGIGAYMGATGQHPFVNELLGENAPSNIQDIMENPENYTSVDYYTVAQDLYGKGEKDEAVFWFYAGQLRLRILASVSTDPTGAPALLGALQEILGPSINQHAGENVDMWAETITKVLEWDAVTPNNEKPEGVSEEVWTLAIQENRKGLEQLREHILTNREELQKEREANGLE